MAIDNWSLRKQKKETSFPAQNKCDNGNNRSQGKCKYKGCAKETTHFCSMSTAVVVLALQPHNKRWEAVALESIFARYYMGAGITYIPIVLFLFLAIISSILHMQNIPVATPEYIQRKNIDSHNRVLYLLCGVGRSIRWAPSPLPLHICMQNCKRICLHLSP